MFAPLIHLPPLPKHQQALHSAGIHSGTLEIDYRPEPPFFRDQPQRYAFARLTLYAHEGAEHQRAETVSLRFQRHVLGPHEPPSESNVSHPRFDYGPLPWSAFYAPALVTPPLPLPASPKLDRLVESVSALDALMHSPELVKALGCGQPINCYLSLYLDVLESQGVPIEVFHNLRDSSWPEQEVLSNPALFNPGTAAALLQYGASHRLA